MPRVLDYIVIRRPPFEVHEGDQSELFGFHVEADAVTRSADAIPAISFQARPPSTPVAGGPDLGGGVDLQIVVNGLPTGTMRIDLDSVRGVWRTFADPALNADSSANFIQFSSERGFVRISDVVLWYQRDV